MVIYLPTTTTTTILKTSKLWKLLENKKRIQERIKFKIMRKSNDVTKIMLTKRKKRWKQQQQQQKQFFNNNPKLKLYKNSHQSESEFLNVDSSLKYQKKNTIFKCLAKKIFVKCCYCLFNWISWTNIRWTRTISAAMNIILQQKQQQPEQGKQQIQILKEENVKKNERKFFNDYTIISTSTTTTTTTTIKPTLLTTTNTLIRRREGRRSKNFKLSVVGQKLPQISWKYGSNNKHDSLLNLQLRFVIFLPLLLLLMMSSNIFHNHGKCLIFLPSFCFVFLAKISNNSPSVRLPIYLSVCPFL